MPVPFAEPLVQGEELLLVRKIVERSEKCKRGIRVVQRSLAEGGAGGLVVLTGDTTPHDLISHLPGLCKEKGVPFVFIPSRFDLPNASGKPSTCVFIPAGCIEDAEKERLLGPKPKPQ